MEFGLLTLFSIFLICAIIDTLAPGILGATAYIMLMNSEKKIQRLVIFLIITQGSYFILGIIFMMGNEVIIEFITKVRESFLMGVFLLIFGLSLVLLSVTLPQITKNNTNIYARFFRKIDSELRVKTILILALFIFLMEVTQAIPYWAVLGLMTYNSFSIPLWMPTLAIYNTLMVLPSIILIVIYKIRSDKTESTLSKLKDRLMTSNAFLWAIGGAGGIFLHLGLNVIIPH